MAGPWEQFAPPTPAGPWARFAAPSEQPSGALDFLKSIPSGLVKGFSGAASAAGQGAALEMGQQDTMGDVPGAPEVAKQLEKNVTGDLHKPQTPYGRAGETLGTFFGNPAWTVGPGSLGVKALTTATGALGSELGGQATEGTKAEPFMRVAGAMAGGAVPSVAARAITPLPATAARQRLVDILNDEGVTSLTAGQRTGNEALRYAESTLGNAPFAGGKTNAITRRGQEQFTEAATRRAGAGPDFGPETAAANQQRLGNEFDRLSAGSTAQLDPQFATDIRQVIRDYGRTLPSEQRERVYNFLTDIAQQGNSLPGEVYQTTRSRASRIADGARQSDPEFAGAMRGIRDALDNAMRRSLPQADREAWDLARQQYGGQKTLEKSVSKAGEATAEGQIPPANLRNTVAAENRGAYARGEGPFSELSRAGSDVMAPMPQSGTGPRAMMHTIASLMGAGVGGLAGGGVGSAPGAVAGAVLGPAAAGRVLMSRPVQGYLGNQALTDIIPQLDPRRAAVVNALIAAQQQQGQ